MKLTTEQKEQIKDKFQLVETVEQFAMLLQWIYDEKYPNKDPKLKLKIEKRDLNYYAFKKKDRYIKFEIAKKNKNETRPISAPKYKLKVIQKCINEVLNSVFIPHKNAFGFIPSRSVVDNAKLHIGKNYVYNIDIEGFFPNTEFRRIKTVLGLKPFLLVDKKEPLAFLIANLCCEKIKAVKEEGEIEISALPQGAPTSPTLTNIVCQRLDKRLTKFAKRYGATYSRYADDITFSAHSDIFNKWFKSRLKVILERQEKYKINLSKERLQDWNKRQEVTGVIVNKKANVSRSYIKDIRFWLNSWENKKMDFTQMLFMQFYPNKKGFLRYKGSVPPFQNFLLGKILYLGMVRGKDDAMYKNLMNRFVNQLQASKIEDKGINLYHLLAVWEQKGIDEAMQLYFELKNKDGTQQS